MSYPIHEENYDRADKRDRINLRETDDFLAVARKQEEADYSQILVNATIEEEQTHLSVKPKVQDYPGIPESERKRDNVEKIMMTEPTRMIDPVKTPPVKGTVSGGMREFLEVRSIQAKTKAGAIPVTKMYREEFFESQPAQGLPVTERKISGTPVQGLNLLDQFFNFVNRIFKVS